MKSFSIMRFRDAPFTLKFVLLTSAICLFCVILCTGCFLLQERKTLHREHVINHRSIARMLAFNSSAVVTFQQQEAGEGLLRGLDSQADVVAAALYEATGDRVAAYLRPAAKDSDSLVKPLPKEWATVDETADWLDEDGFLIIAEPIVEDGEVLGAVILRSSLEGLHGKQWKQIPYAVGVASVALIGTVLLSMILQRLISAPILRLAEIAKSITEGGNYSVRVQHGGKDELGTLYTAFNQMLHRIQASDDELKSYNDRLESSVAQRTAELQNEVLQHQQTEQSLIVAKDNAERANHVKSEFLANMSHEIRTPMNAIIGFTDLMLQDNPSEDHREYLDLVSGSSKHLLSLINDILDISKIEAGRMEIIPEVMSPHALVSEVVSFMRVKAQEKGINLDYYWDGPIPEVIRSDPGRFKQVLLNLVGNAIKFTSKGAVGIRIQLAQEGETSLLKVNIIDSGIGIPQDKLESIFDPFTQADYSTTRHFGGTGLGLTICKRIVDALGGSITVESKEGVGSVFTFTLPTGSLEGISLTEAAADVGTGDVMASCGGSDAIQKVEPLEAGMPRILVVEDGETNRKLVSIVLRRAGYEVEIAENGLIGFELATSRPYDLVLMDMQMPVMDGYTSTSKLRAAGYMKPIVALTAHAMSGDGEKCREAGCSDYLTKPIDGELLVNTVSSWLATEQAST